MDFNSRGPCSGAFTAITIPGFVSQFLDPAGIDFSIPGSGVNKFVIPWSLYPIFGTRLTGWSLFGVTIVAMAALLGLTFFCFRKPDRP